MSKFCRYCGNRMTEGALYCGKCGASAAGMPAPVSYTHLYGAIASAVVRGCSKVGEQRLPAKGQKKVIFMHGSFVIPEALFMLCLLYTSRCV